MVVQSFLNYDRPPRDSRECPDCGQDFTPTPDNEKFCVRCNARFEAQVEHDHYDDLNEFDR